jgi:putative DNA primase/helicase
MVWDGSRWATDIRGEVDKLGKETVRSIDDDVCSEPDDDQRKRLRTWATKSESRAGRENLISLARAELAAAPEDFDRDQWALNVRNGTIDLRTGELRPHRREDFITKLAPVTYDATATAPLWEAFLAKVMSSNDALIGYLQRIIGYALTGVTSEHVLVFSYGTGDNGKSVFHQAIAQMLGDYASKAPRGLLYESKSERHPTELADLFNARLVLCPEVKRGQRFDEALVKDLVGEDKVKARRMHQDFWEFAPTHKLFVCGNHKPVIQGTDHGIWRRIRLIPWSVTISAAEKDRSLLGKLEKEFPGILAWAVRGCLAWQRDGLGEPPEVNAATEVYREESNPLAEFFESRCTFEADAKISRRALRVAYEAWAKEIGAEPLGAKRFSENLRARGVVDGGTIREGALGPVDAWKGVRLLEDRERAAKSEAERP